MPVKIFINPFFSNVTIRQVTDYDLTGNTTYVPSILLKKQHLYLFLDSYGTYICLQKSLVDVILHLPLAISVTGIRMTDIIIWKYGAIQFMY